MKYQFLLVAILFSASLAEACDFCNCYLGLNPHYKKNSIGLRYHYSSYNGTHHDLSEFTDAGLTKDDFWEKRTVTEFHAQWYPVHKLQLIFSLPYIHNTEGMSANGELAMGDHHHGSAETDDAIKGIGDAVALANYQVFNVTNADSTRFSQRLFAGAGIKLPVGKYKLGADADPLERTHQPGSGSWDLLLNASYLGKINRTGINLNASYLLTTENSEHFQFGNRFNANATVYYQCAVKNTLLYPNLGTYFEQAGKDWNENYYLSNSGGTIVYAHAGLDVYFNKLSLSAALQLPVNQTLNTPQPEMKYRLITGISYAIN